jgi:hypothetical protein
MSARDRARLWNGLVLPVQYFKKSFKMKENDDGDDNERVFERVDIEDMYNAVRGRMKDRIR